MTADFRAGSEIGGYILDTYVGGGSFGAVWRGHDATTSQSVAIKLLTGALSSSETAAMRAEIELLAASAASRSRHVVHVLGGGAEPVPHIVMEYVEGDDLSARLKREGKLSAGQTVEIGLAISDALAALNEAGIIHRDIKPANVMTDKDGVIKLTDFGIAKIVGYETMTMTGQAAMTMAYAAPEIWDDGSPFGRPSHKSDLYAMGVLLYQCLTGETPFRGNYGALYKAHLERTPDINVLPPDTPPSLRSLISRCLEKRQEGRPKDAGECVSMLRRAEAELAEATGGASTMNEPRKLGPWLKDAPHESVPWAWRCHHESTGKKATVEVHFADSLDYGARLRKAVAANAGLVPFGAERLIDSNRLLLHPNEAWHEPPPGRFQFWLAREDLSLPAAASVSAQMLRVAVPALVSLIAKSVEDGLALDLAEGTSIVPDGSVYLRRPGLSEATGAPAESALAWLLSLPLDVAARALLVSAPDLQMLAERLVSQSSVLEAGTGEDATQIVRRNADETVIITSPVAPQDAALAPITAPDLAQAGAVSAGPQESLSTSGVRMELRRTSASGARNEYELTLNSASDRPINLRLDAFDDAGALAFSLQRQITLAAAAEERIRVNVQALRPRRLGGKQTTPFTIAASAGGGGNEPPVTIGGEFDEQPPAWPLFAGAGVLGVAVVGILAALLLGGGNNESSAVADAGPTQTATATPVFATATALPTEVPAIVDPPTPVPPAPNRLNCNAIRGTAYQSPEEATWYQQNCITASGGGTTSGGTAPVSTATPVASDGGGTTPSGGTTPAYTPTPVPVTPSYTVVGWALSSPSGICQQGPTCSVNANPTPNGGSMRSCNDNNIFLWIKLHNVQVPTSLMSKMYLPNGTVQDFSPYRETDPEHTYWVRMSGPVQRGTYRHELRVNGTLVSTATVTITC